MFIDFNKYVAKLNKLFEQQNKDQQNILIRNSVIGTRNTQFYSAVTGNGKRVDLYETRKDALYEMNKKGEQKGDFLLLNF